MQRERVFGGEDADGRDPKLVARLFGLLWSVSSNKRLPNGSARFSISRLLQQTSPQWISTFFHLASPPTNVSPMDQHVFPRCKSRDTKRTYQTKK
jgi:hypothetical protein